MFRYNRKHILQLHRTYTVNQTRIKYSDITFIFNRVKSDIILRNEKGLYKQLSGSDGKPCTATDRREEKTEKTHTANYNPFGTNRQGNKQAV